MRSPSKRRVTQLVALLLGLAMVAAACGGNDDSASGGGDEPDTTQPTDSEPDESDVGDPVPGGKLVYGVEADSSTPWTPANTICAISCHMIMRSVYDALVLTADDGTVKPNLLESFESNEDATVWTLTPRAGITFHDGTPFDAEAIKVNLDAQRASFLRGKTLQDIQDTAVSEDGASVVVTMDGSWRRFPAFLTGEIGYMASPTWLAAVEGDPTLAAKPVGTGPFVFESYEVGGSFIATKNADYWRADEGLPYLDEIEFRVLSDSAARTNALQAGDIDIMHTSSGLQISELRENGSIELTETSAFAETAYVLMNHADPESPINDIRIRQALAMAVDNEVYVERRTAGVQPVANGPFSPDQAGYLDETPYPAYDPEAAKALVEEYKADNGVDSVDLAFTTTTDPANLETAELFKQFWDEAGFNIELAQIEQGSFIVTALTGDFDMFTWRNHGGVDPDRQRVWWHSETADDPPGLALNFGRIKDDLIDEQLDVIRTSADDAEVTAAAEAVNTQLSEQVYNLWLSWTVWGIAKAPEVNGLDTFVLPDGSSELYGNGIAGSHQVSQLWVEQ